jgi:predicted Zn finger-like uncharacterized protein
MVSDPLTDGWYVGTQNAIDPMLIVCPNCSTSYAIEPASLGAAGRTVRCARCSTTWFVDGSKPAPEMTVAAEDTTEAEGTFTGVLRPDRPVGSSDAEAEQQPAEAEQAVSSGTQDDPATAPAEIPAAIGDAPSVVPAIEPPAHPNADTDSDEIENFAARRKRLQARRKQARRSSRWTALILVLFAFNVALIGARSEVVRFFPQTASLFAAVGLPVNLRNLKFENMRISKEAQEGLSTLVVEGNIVNISTRATEVPRLRFAARDAAEQEVYTWTALPSRSILGPGEKLDFRSRFVSPPASAVDVMVRFAGAQDATPGAK